MNTSSPEAPPAGATVCPSCGGAMLALNLGGHLGTSVAVDMCLGCQVLWFDTHESLQLTPASTLRLFRQIGEATDHERRPLASVMRCPRCALTLSLVHDRQRTTRFQYRRCARQHGRLITFLDFLREKNFLRPMSPTQVEELRRQVGAVNCSNCGAAIDLVTHSSCTHCGSALSMIDTHQAGQLVAELRAADRSGQPVDPALPLRLEQARREVEAVFASAPHGSPWTDVATSRGTVLEGLRSLVAWLTRERPHEPIR